MKNIHLLPTEKPSRLFKFANELHLDTTPKDYYKKYILYITSDEEIKEGDWFITKTNDVLKVQKPEKSYDPIGKKIILTTDQDLINEGVQAIDDEFLEWFVKNPSCESVEVELKNDWNLEKGLTMPNFFYKIITTEKEPKQSNWQFEISSGHNGYRNTITGEWIYESEYLKILNKPKQERLKDIELEEVFGSSHCQFSVIENSLAKLYRNQEKILKAIKLLRNDD
jgi:hypothetical protein